MQKSLRMKLCDLATRHMKYLLWWRSKFMLTCAHFIAECCEPQNLARRLHQGPKFLPFRHNWQIAQRHSINRPCLIITDILLPSSCCNNPCYSLIMWMRVRISRRCTYGHRTHVYLKSIHFSFKMILTQMFKCLVVAWDQIMSCSISYPMMKLPGKQTTFGLWLTWCKLDTISKII